MVLIKDGEEQAISWEFYLPVEKFFFGWKKEVSLSDEEKSVLKVKNRKEE